MRVIKFILFLLLMSISLILIGDETNNKNILFKIEKVSGISIPNYANEDDIIFMYETAKELEIPIRIAFRLIHCESRFVAEPDNGQGYMQVIPLTFNAYSKKLDLVDLNNVQKNIFVGMTYLKDMYNYWNSWKYAVASYNVGKSAVIKNGISEKRKNYIRFITK